MKKKHPLTALSARQVRVLRRRMPEASASARSLHQARVASRRLREMLPVTGVAAGARSGKTRRIVRRLTRALGPVREIDVALALLDEVAKRHPKVPAPAIAAVRERLQQERAQRQKDMIARLERVKLEKLTRRVRELGAAIGDSADDAAWHEALADRLRSRSRRLRQAIAGAGALYSPERLHVVRIAIKKLRYALELARDSGAAPAGPLVRTLKSVQEGLGELNDLQVLIAHVRGATIESTARSEVALGLAGLARALEEECRQLHARFVRARPRLAAVCQQCLDQVAPRVASRRGGLSVALARAPHRRAS
jgi:CHAD domain-containing protein